MDSLLQRFLIELAIILISTKVFGLVAKKLGLPQVVGMLIAGILIGPAVWSPMTNGAFIPVKNSGYLTMLAEIGVILLMFSAGLETDLKELKRTGLVSSLIAVAGVVVPMAICFGIAVPFFGLGSFDNVLSCVFIGVIATATSVGITVETLRELGKLKSKMGTIILSAAIIDDVIGIIILTFVIGLKNPSADASYIMIIKTVVFFVLAIGVGIGLHYLFKYFIKKYPHHRRVPIFGLVVCLIYAYCAERFFGIADITGAYLAGIVLSGMKDSEYIENKIDVSGYMIFTPVFFAAIGIKMDFSGFSVNILLFALLFVLGAMIGKIVGCGGVAKLCKFNFRESLKVGVGMMVRGEVALIVTQRGISEGIIPSIYLAPVILLVLVSSLISPIIIKLLFKNANQLPLDGNGLADLTESANKEENNEISASEEEVCQN